MHYRKFFGELLVQLKAGAYKVVQVKAKEAVKTLPEYDEAIMKEFGKGTLALTRFVPKIKGCSQNLGHEKC